MEEIERLRKHIKKVLRRLDIADANDISADQKAALESTSGEPSASNQFVTNSDSRLSDARTPLSHTHPSSGFQFPVGAIYIETTGVNPAITFGYGTWAQRASGKFIVGIGADAEFNTGGKFGGEKTHTLTLSEIPSHAHTQRRHATTTGALTGVTTAPDTTSSNPQNAGPATASVGGDGAHNNLPPYEVIGYIWERVS